MSDDSLITLRDGTRATIRQTRVADAAAVVELERGLAVDGTGMVLSVDQIRSVDDEARRIDDVYRAMSAGDATLALVAEVGSRIVGTAEVRQLAPARCRHVGIVAVGVHTEFRRQRVAHALLEHVVEHARAFELSRLELYVRADNDAAHRLYEGLGFHHEGTRRNFVRLDDGTFVDDLIYARFLS